jgi:predicted RNase H-like HicB family nuclease
MRWMTWGTRNPKKKSARLTLKVSVVVEPDEDGFHAYCPALKGLHVDGRTKKEALENAEKALVVYLRSLADHGEPLPIGADLTLDRCDAFEVPKEAFLRSLTIECPTLQMSGTR